MRWLFCVGALLAGCSRSSAPPDPEALTPAERARVATLSPLGPVPPDPTNAYADDPRAVQLGKRLFFDPALSGPPGGVSCETCHHGPALDDRRTPNHVSAGTGRGKRNTPPVLNAVFYERANWGGKFETQWALVLGAIENPEVMNGSRPAIAQTVIAGYRADYEALFGEPLPAAPDPAAADRIATNAAKAIAAFMRTRVARNAPFDRYVAGDEQAISRPARRGLRLFLAHCESCHRGPFFTDQQFHALGIMQSGDGVPDEDLGRFSDAPGPSVGRGTFRTPTLRNVAVTAPYMHAGQLRDLAAVVRFYNVGGGNIPGIDKSPHLQRLGLSADQQADLVAFLETLTDTAITGE